MKNLFLDGEFLQLTFLTEEDLCMTHKQSSEWGEGKGPWLTLELEWCGKKERTLLAADDASSLHFRIGGTNG